MTTGTPPFWLIKPDFCGVCRPNGGYPQLTRRPWPETDVGRPITLPCRTLFQFGAGPSPTSSRTHGALPARSAAPRDLAGTPARRRFRRCPDSAPRRERAARISRVRDPGPRFRPRPLWRLRPRLPDRVPLQGRRGVPVLHHAAHGRDRRRSRPLERWRRVLAARRRAHRGQRSRRVPIPRSPPPHAGAPRSPRHGCSHASTRSRRSLARTATARCA